MNSENACACGAANGKSPTAKPYDNTAAITAEIIAPGIIPKVDARTIWYGLLPHYNPTLKFQTGATDITGQYTVLPDASNPVLIDGNTSKTFKFTVDVSAGAELGQISIDGEVIGKDINSNSIISLTNFLKSSICKFTNQILIVIL